MSTYSPNIVTARIDTEGAISTLRVSDQNIVELLLDVIIQLRLISLKLDCLQPGDQGIDETELDMEDL